jgi:hypothetical protein
MISTELCKDLAMDLQDSLRNWWEEDEEAVLRTTTRENVLRLLSDEVLDDLTTAIERAMEASRKTRDDLPKTLMRVANAVGYVVTGTDLRNAKKNEVYRLSLLEATQILETFKNEEQPEGTDYSSISEFFSYELAGCFWRLVSST